MGSAGCGDREGGLHGGQWVTTGEGRHLSGFASPSQPRAPACVEAARVFPPLPGPCASALCPAGHLPALFPQLVSDTRRASDIQWFREAYGAVTRTVRVVALEQSRQQRGWVFTAGEPCAAFVPGPPAPRSGLLSSWQAVGG